MNAPLLFTRTKTDIATRSYGTSKLNPVNSAGMSTWNERDFDRSHLWRQCHAEILYLDENCAAGGSGEEGTSRSLEFVRPKVKKINIHWLNDRRTTIRTIRPLGYFAMCIRHEFSSGNTWFQEIFMPFWDDFWKMQDFSAVSDYFSSFKLIFIFLDKSWFNTGVYVCMYMA